MQKKKEDIKRVKESPDYLKNIKRPKSVDS